MVYVYIWQFMIFTYVYSIHVYMWYIYTVYVVIIMSAACHDKLKSFIVVHLFTYYTSALTTYSD